MFRNILLLAILLILGFGLWVSQDFKAISAGVAIFLFGMLSLEQGFNALTGGTLERILRLTTSNRWKSLGFGFFLTTLMQSSSLVSVISISFLSAGLISLAAGIGIIFGANLGTTTGAWLIAGFGLKIDIASYAMPLLAFGIVLLFQAPKKMKGVGYVLCGIGFLFLGIHYMKEGFDAFKETIDLARYSLEGYQGVLIFMLLGIIATVVMQSSHATLALIITALAVEQISYENALALAIGTNIGTTITAILGSLSANESGKRLAGAHFIFNLTSALIAVALIYEWVDVVNWLAFHLGIADDNYTLKLAVFHSLFNLIGIVVMLPFIHWIVIALERVIPDKIPEMDQPMYLSSASAEFPDTAIEAVRNETLRVYDAAINIIVSGLGIKRSDDGFIYSLASIYDGRPLSGEASIDAMYEKHIKAIYSAIVVFISDTAFSRRDDHSANLQWLREANTEIVEAVKAAKHLQKNVQRYVVSTNPDIREAYNRLRQHVASTIQNINDTRSEEGGVMDMLDIDSLKLIIDEHQNHMVDELTELIGRRKISPQMGSSLLNDGVYAHQISMNLALAAQALFGAGERELLPAALAMSLDEGEREMINDQMTAQGMDDTVNRAGGES